MEADTEPMYAVYIVVIEDSEFADADLAGRVESLARVDGDMEFDGALVMMQDLWVHA